MGKDVPADSNGVARTGSTSSAKESTRVSVVDILRILGGLFLLNCLLSYFITNDSVLWGYRPWYVRPNELMRYIVRPVSPSTNPHALTNRHYLAWSSRSDRSRAQELRRHRPQKTNLPRPKRHHLRCHRRPPLIRPGRRLPRLRRRRRRSRLHNRLLRGRLDAGLARCRVDVRAHGRDAV